MNHRFSTDEHFDWYSNEYFQQTETTIDPFPNVTQIGMVYLRRELYFYEYQKYSL